MNDNKVQFRFGKTKVAKEEFYGPRIKNSKSLNVLVDNKVMLKLIKTKNNFKYLIGYLYQQLEK